MKNIKKNITSLIIIITLLLSFCFFVDTTFASDWKNDQEGISILEKIFGPANDVRSIVINILNVLFTFLGIIMVYLIMYGGFRWMTSGGNEQQVLEAKNYIKNACIGIATILASYGITFFVINSIVKANGG